MCAHTSLSQGAFYRRGLRVISITPLWTSKEPSEHAPSWGVLLICRMRNTWSLVFYLGRAQPPFSIVLQFSSWRIYPRKEGLSTSCLNLTCMWNLKTK